MKKKLCSIVMLLLMVVMLPFMFQSTRVLADTGPHSSVEVTVEGIENQPYYVTLLSKKDHIGPWCVGGENYESMGPQEVWQKFSDYKDADGYFFIGNYKECSETNTFKWSYYPPSEFKILIYFPNQDQMICSKDTYDQFAFHTYYTVKLSESDILLQGSHGKEEESWPTPYRPPYWGYIGSQQISVTYDLSHEILAFLFRVVVTVLIELAVAWFFSFRKKKQIMIIVVTNVLTQGILNLLLNLMDFQKGPWGYRLYYFALECIVFVVEGFIYQKMLIADETGTSGKKKVWLYALTANIASFVLGMIISIVVPSMF